MALTEERVKEFEELESEAEGLDELIDVADGIADAGDKEWAKKIYKKAEAVAEDCDDFQRLVDSVHKNLGDKEWAKKVYKKAEGPHLHFEVRNGLGPQNPLNYLS